VVVCVHRLGCHPRHLKNYSLEDMADVLFADEVITEYEKAMAGVRRATAGL